MFTYLGSCWLKTQLVGSMYSSLINLYTCLVYVSGIWLIKNTTCKHMYNLLINVHTQFTYLGSGWLTTQPVVIMYNSLINLCTCSVYVSGIWLIKTQLVGTMYNSLVNLYTCSVYVCRIWLIALIEWGFTTHLTAMVNCGYTGRKVQVSHLRSKIFVRHGIWTFRPAVTGWLQTQPVSTWIIYWHISVHTPFTYQGSDWF